MSRLTSPSMRRLAHLFFVYLLLALGLLNIAQPLQDWFFGAPGMRDFLQMYLLGRALRDGAELYAPLNLLAERYLGPVPYLVFGHPTPHPPTLGLLAVPPSFLDYETAARLWLLLQIAGYGGAVYLLARVAGLRPRPDILIAITVVLFSWYPIYRDLMYGQVNVFLLLCAVGVWLSLDAAKSFRAGIFLGVALLIKPTLWPLGLLMAFRRSWPGVLSAVIILVFGYAVAASLVGIDHISAYFTHALPATTSQYRSDPLNQSLWSLFQPRIVDSLRWFRPSQPTILLTWDTAASAILPLLAFGFACLAATRYARLRWAFSVTICVALVLNPIAWEHYLVVALLPAALVLRWLREHGFPRRETSLAGAVAVLLAVPYPIWITAAMHLRTSTPSPDPAALGPLPTIFMLMPLLSLAALTALCVYLERKDTLSATQSSRPDRHDSTHEAKVAGATATRGSLL